MDEKFRIFKENGVNRDERTVSTLTQATAIYEQYFRGGYSVRIVEIESGTEYAMENGKLVPFPYSRTAQAPQGRPAGTIHAVPPRARAPHSASLKDIVISDELRSRRIRKIHARAEIASMHALADLLPQGSSVVLKRLAQLTIELCDAGSGGISLIEAENDRKQIFRWRALAGEFEKYEGGTTPGDWSPCGECLKWNRPMLYSYPARFFTYFQDVPTPIGEGLVIPLHADEQPVGTIWIVATTSNVILMRKMYG